jgi:hypothetical protein
VIGACSHWSARTGVGGPACSPVVRPGLRCRPLVHVGQGIEELVDAIVSRRTPAAESILNRENDVPTRQQAID